MSEETGEEGNLSPCLPRSSFGKLWAKVARGERWGFAGPPSPVAAGGAVGGPFPSPGEKKILGESCAGPAPGENGAG